MLPDASAKGDGSPDPGDAESSAGDPTLVPDHGDNIEDADSAPEDAPTDGYRVREDDTTPSVSEDFRDDDYTPDEPQEDRHHSPASCDDNSDLYMHRFPEAYADRVDPLRALKDYGDHDDSLEAPMDYGDTDDHHGPPNGDGYDNEDEARHAYEARRAYEYWRDGLSVFNNDDIYETVEDEEADTSPSYEGLGSGTVEDGEYGGAQIGMYGLHSAESTLSTSPTDGRLGHGYGSYPADDNNKMPIENNYDHYRKGKHGRKQTH